LRLIQNADFVPLVRCQAPCIRRAVHPRVR
jgi:hypothetical protein